MIKLCDSLLKHDFPQVSSVIQMRVLEVLVLITQLSGDHLKVGLVSFLISRIIHMMMKNLQKN